MDKIDKNKKFDKKIREHLKKTGKEYYGNNIVQYVVWVDQERSHLKYLYLSPSALPILILILLCYFCFSNLELFGGFLKTLLIFITIGSAITWIFDYIFKDFLKYRSASEYSPKFPKPNPMPFKAKTLFGLISNAL